MKQIIAIALFALISVSTLAQPVPVLTPKPKIKLPSVDKQEQILWKQIGITLCSPNHSLPEILDIFEHIQICRSDSLKMFKYLDLAAAYSNAKRLLGEVPPLSSLYKPIQKLLHLDDKSDVRLSDHLEMAYDRDGQFTIKIFLERYSVNDSLLGCYGIYHMTLRNDFVFSIYPEKYCDYSFPTLKPDTVNNAEAYSVIKEFRDIIKPALVPIYRPPLLDILLDKNIKSQNEGVEGWLVSPSENKENVYLLTKYLQTNKLLLIQNFVEPIVDNVFIVRVNRGSDQNNCRINYSYLYNSDLGLGSAFSQSLDAQNFLSLSNIKYITRLTLIQVLSLAAVTKTRVTLSQNPLYFNELESVGFARFDEDARQIVKIFDVNN